MLKASEVIGKRFGRLVVIKIDHIPGFGSAVICKCDCGNEKTVKHFNLLHGSTKSCGCLWKQKITTHGSTDTRVYGIWRGMKSRCRPNSRNHVNYYDSGIEVCKRWQKFENFYADMGDPPEGLTLERVDNNKGYSPDNCVWDTYEAQENNKRNNHRITAFGKTQTLTQWCKEYRLPLNTLKNRIVRAKMKPEDALMASLYKQQRGVKYGNREK